MPGHGDALAGAYVLVLELARETEIAVGRLGRIRFEEGAFAYAGSALAGFDGRLGRHLRGGAKRHWHVDYLREHAATVRAWVAADGRGECDLARELGDLAGLEAGPKGFGVSDCRCRTHLFRLPNGCDTGSALGLVAFAPGGVRPEAG